MAESQQNQVISQPLEQSSDTAFNTVPSHQNDEDDIVQLTATLFLTAGLDRLETESEVVVNTDLESETDSSATSSFGDSISNNSDDGDLPIECIIAEFTTKAANTWYLTKWQGAPLLNSSWEHAFRFSKDPEVLKSWAAKKESIAEGNSLGVDLELFTLLVERLKNALRERGRLRALRQQLLKVKRGISKT